MNLIGIKEAIPSTAFPTDDELRAVINQTHMQGGIVVINHQPWSFNGQSMVDIPTLEQLQDWGLDYVEAVNGITFDYQGYRYALDHGMGVVTGTDMHSPNVGVNGWTVMIPANFSEQSILDELKAINRTSIIYDAINSPYVAWPIATVSNVMLDPFFRFGGLFKTYYDDHHGLYSFNNDNKGKPIYCKTGQFEFDRVAIEVLAFWLVLAFVVCETLRQLLSFSLPRLYSKVKKKNKSKNKRITESFEDEFPLLEEYENPFTHRKTSSKHFFE